MTHMDIKAKADNEGWQQQELHKAAEVKMVSMARDRIYFALQSYQDKTSFDDNAIWLLS